jgi:hypothetical protein
VRRVISLALVGLGAFLVVAAGLTRLYLRGQVIKFPLNEFLITTPHADNANGPGPAGGET